MRIRNYTTFLNFIILAKFIVYILLLVHWSYFTWCDHVWGAPVKMRSRTLPTLYKQAVRIRWGVKSRTCFDSLFKEFDRLKFQDIDKYLIGTLMFKSYNDQLMIIESWFQKNVKLYHQTRQSGHCIIFIVLELKLCQSISGFCGAKHKTPIVDFDPIPHRMCFVGPIWKTPAKLSSPFRWWTGA